MFFSYAEKIGTYPIYNKVEACDTNWTNLLKRENLRELPENAKMSSPCIRAAEFYEKEHCYARFDDGSPRASVGNILQMHGAIYDLDVWPFGVKTPEEIWEAYGKPRMVLWTSFSHTPQEPRYKVYIPFSQPVPPLAYKNYFWPILGATSGGLGDSSQSNPDRLAYVGTVLAGNRAFADFWIFQGRVIDPYAEFGNPSEEDISHNSIIVRSAASVPSNLDETGWMSVEAAKEKAHIYFSQAATNVLQGDRHAHLMKWGCRLFWEFWLEEEDVYEVLMGLNKLFPVPKTSSEVRAEVTGAWKRTRGDSAVEQKDVEGNLIAPGVMRLLEPATDKHKVADLISKLKKSKYSAEKEEGKLLEACTTESKSGGFTLPENTREFFLQVAKILGKQLPDEHHYSLMGVIRPCWEFCAAENDVSGQELEVAIVKAMQSKKEYLANKETEALNDIQTRILEGSGNKRTTHYTKEEIEKWASLHGVTPDNFDRRLIIKVKHSYFLFSEGTYLDFGVDLQGLYTLANTVLAPFEGYSDSKVVLGEIAAKSHAEFAKEYVTVAGRIRIELANDYSYYDAKTREFVMATVRRNPDLVPQYSDFVDGFLNTFPNPEDLKTWLAYLPDLTTPLQALYLQGPKQSGKSLFAKALSKLYTQTPDGNPLSMENAVDKFSEQWVTNPLFFADEQMPAVLQNNLALFREHITKGNRSVEPKGEPKRQVNGYLRYVMLANNEDMIPKSKMLASVEDVSATKDRIMHLKMTSASRKYLDSFSHQQRNAMVRDNLLANHVLYLQATRPARGHGRFPFTPCVSETLEQVGQQDEKSIVLTEVLKAFDTAAQKLGATTPVMPGSDMGVTFEVLRHQDECFFAFSLEQLSAVLLEKYQKNLISAKRLKKLLEPCLLRLSEGKFPSYRNKSRKRCVIIQAEKIVKECDIHELSHEALQEAMIAISRYYIENNKAKKVQAWKA